MVKVETRIQLAIKEILEEEIWKHLKTNKNLDKALSIASLIEPFDEGPDTCYEDCRSMCFGCYDGYKYSLDWRASYNLRDKKPFSLLGDHDLHILIDAINDKVHKCNEWCSDFICYKYIGATCSVMYCHNLFKKERKNMKYCTWCKEECWPIYRNNYFIKNLNIN